MKQLKGLSLLSVLALGSFGSARADDANGWMRHFRIGGSVAVGISTEFKMNGNFSVSGSNPGPLAAGANHTYDDGFVKVDDTGNALGVTSNWGYNNASQFDAANQKLTYTATTDFDAASSRKVTDGPDLGVDIAYGGTFAKWERVAIGAEFGFNLTPFGNRDRSGLTGTLTQVTDTYNTGGIIVPGAPYTGNSSGVGPVISDTPNAVDRVTTQTPGTIGGEGILYNLRLGPLLRWEFYPRWTLNGSAGGALGIFDATYRFNEQITVNNTTTANAGRFGSTDLTYGGYAGAVVMYDTGHYWEVFLGAHFMSLQDVKISGGGREANTKLTSTIYLVAGMNWSF
jgi:hypothetical protein